MTEEEKMKEIRYRMSHLRDPDSIVFVDIFVNAFEVLMERLTSIENTLKSIDQRVYEST